MRGVLAAALVSLACPTVVRAWPVDVYLDLQVGVEKFQRLTADQAIVQDPAIASAELLTSGELLVTPRSAGRTLMLVSSEGRLAIWRLRVAPKGQQPTPVLDDAAVVAARKACPGLVVREGSDAVLQGSVRDDRCRMALGAVLRTDQFTAKQAELTFDVGALQSQLRDLDGALQAAGIKGVSLAYSGTELVLKGSVTPAARMQVLWTAFEKTVGRLGIDDQLQVSEQRVSP